MAYFKRIIVLNGIDDKNRCGIIKLNVKGGMACGEASLSGVTGDNVKILISGKTRVNAFDSAAAGGIISDFAAGDDIYCLLLQNNAPIMYGSTNKDKYRCFNLKDEYFADYEKNIPNPAENVENSVGNFAEDGELKAENRKNADTTENFEDIKKTFSRDAAETLEKDESGETEFKNCVTYGGSDFFGAVKPQLDEMFICYPPDKQLAEIVPNSKWIRVAVADDYYVVGIIYDLDEPIRICYGIHGVFGQKPPAEIREFCQWLPISRDDAEGEGYWTIYQDAKTGKTL